MRSCFSQKSCRLQLFLQVHSHNSKFRFLSIYVFALPFLSSFLFAAVFRLLPGFFRVEEFPRKRERGKNYIPWTSKGWKGKFCSEFSTKILERFGAYFKLYQSNHAGLGIVGKVLLCF